MRKLAMCVAGGFVVCALALVIGTQADAGGKKKGAAKVKVGDTAPKFTSMDENGKKFKSSDVVGKKILVVYFYPADFTGGCTKQACGFRDDFDNLKGKNVYVVGVSGDSVSTHKMFKAHHKLNFTLLADEKGAVAQAFGVPFSKGGNSPTIDENGKKGTAPRGVTIRRWTAVIDLDGKIAAIYEVANAGGDAKKVEGIVEKLEKK